jgi:triosephosphate isomerase
MRRKFIAGNWKMHTNASEAAALASAVAAGSVQHPKVLVAVCPPFPYLQAVAAAIQGSPVALGAQNVSSEPVGAFTGEVSGAMLVDIGCRYCIVGHSERRHVLGESDAFIRRKVKAVLAVGLLPIVCVGELLAEREKAETNGVVTSQVASAIAGLTEDQVQTLVFAYEPVWAIGTGRNATPEQAEEVHSHIRKILSERYNAKLASQVVILYGGSVKRDNVASLLGQPNVDGALVGGASLNAADFLKIVQAADSVSSREG